MGWLRTKANAHCIEAFAVPDFHQPGADDPQAWVLEVVIESDPQPAVEVIKQVLDHLETKGWSGRDLFGIHMAMEEALMNAIKHGNRNQRDKIVTISITITDHRFYCRITDEGEGFAPDEVPDPTWEGALECESGRGLALIRNYMDQAIYNEVGNSIELIRDRRQDRDATD